MREIKFKMWDSNAREFVKIQNNYTFWEDGELKPIQSYLKLIEFTGFYDTNGNEIYAGDVLDKKYKWVVQFVNGEWIGNSPVSMMNSIEPLAEILRKREKAGVPIEIIGNNH